MWHLRATLAIAAPIALSLLAEMAMGLISTMMLGGLGANALAAGGLGTNLFFTPLIVLQGVLSGIGVLAAGAIGAARPADIPPIYWAGIALGAALTIPMFALLSMPGPILRSIGEPERLVGDVSAYLHVLRWGAPAGIIGIGVMRQFLPAVGLQRMLLWVMPAGIALHALLNQVLIHGGFGVPGFGFAGSAAATVGTLWALTLGMVALLHGQPRFRRYVSVAWPRWTLMRPLLAIGLPVGATFGVEAGVFLATGVLAGRLGPTMLAAHTVALSVSSVSFMVPLSFSQAANVRVATAMGANDRATARRAGFSAIGLSMAFEAIAALTLTLIPGRIVAAYLGHATVANAATSLLAARLLRVAAVFQMADGTQVAASGALRGLQDTRVPMLLAAAGYWGIGFCSGWFLAFHQAQGAVGLWWGLCIGLAVVAVSLTTRFTLRSRTDTAAAMHADEAPPRATPR